MITPAERDAPDDTGSVTLSFTARLILGMVNEGHCTGYAITREVKRSTSPYWTASPGGIYPELQRLRESGLLTADERPRGQVDRCVYGLTDSGDRALRAWLLNVRPPVMQVRDETLLRLRFSDALPPADRLSLLRHMRDVHSRALTRFSEPGDGRAGEGDGRSLADDFVAAWHAWACEWCTGAERRLTRSS